MNDNSARRPLFAEIEPAWTGTLQVDDLHTLYVEEVGAADGLPAVVLHGGPGGGCTPSMRRFLDPDRWRVTLFDQRGSGRSTPRASIENNTTWHLVEDIERVREARGVEKWCVFGGSWGSTLALAYAVTYPERVSALILRGVFLLRRTEIEWFYQDGASRLFPDAFERYVAPIPQAERGDLLAAFHKRLSDPSPKVRAQAAQAWARWEGDCLSIGGPEARPEEFDNADFNDAFARIECHYFMHRGFFERDGWLLDQVDRFRHIPGVIVQGRYDVVTPMDSAWALHKAWPEARFLIVPDAGHSSTEPGVADALVRAGEAMADRLGG